MHSPTWVQNLAQADQPGSRPGSSLHEAGLSTQLVRCNPVFGIAPTQSLPPICKVAQIGPVEDVFGQVACGPKVFWVLRQFVKIEKVFPHSCAATTLANVVPETGSSVSVE